METVHPNECALWAACQYIAEYYNACPVDVLGEDCLGAGCTRSSKYAKCWILHFQKVVA